MNKVTISKVLGKAREVVESVADRRNRAFHRQRTILYPAMREAHADNLARALPPASMDNGLGEQLSRTGLALLPNLLGPSQLEEIHAYLEDKAVRDPYHRIPAFRAATGAPAGTHIARYDLADILDCPHLLTIANDPRVLAAVAAYVGGKPTLSALRLWWSFPHGEEAERTELFHRDMDDWRFVKLFVYLTDVDETSGPHIFVRGSHRIAKLTEQRRFSDAEVAAAFGTEGTVTLTGPAGTSFLETTYGIHRGPPPTARRRLMFQPLYRLGPTIYAPRRALRRARGDDHADPYVSRLFVS